MVVAMVEIVVESGRLSVVSAKGEFRLTQRQRKFLLRGRWKLLYDAYRWICSEICSSWVH